MAHSNTGQVDSNSTSYQAGWAKAEILLSPDGHAMFGYGMWHHRATEQRTPLYARCLYITDHHDHSLIFVCCDLGYISRAMRETVEQQLQDKMASDYSRERLVLTATHTHSGPGGCSHEALYNVVTPGFVPEHLHSVVSAIVKAIEAAKADRQTTHINLAQQRITDDIDVAWNRSVDAYNQNPEVTPCSDTQTHLALDRDMRVLGLQRGDQLAALLSIFGVHATCLSNTLSSYDGDNKGYAAQITEDALVQEGVTAPVTIFAQGTAGDVSPHYHGPGDVARRAKITGEAEYDYARNNGRIQSDHALYTLQEQTDVASTLAITGDIDGVLTYIDFTQLKADPKYAQNHTDAYTSDPCHGVSFFTGTRVDGPGMPMVLGTGASFLSKLVKKMRLRNLKTTSKDTAYYQSLYKGQGNKDILMESGNRKKVLGFTFDKIPLPNMADPILGALKRQATSGALDKSPLIPTVLPLQIVKLGQLAIVCCPGEFTTMAGKRIQTMLQEKFANQGIDEVIICTYCNDYMGYVTTQEEYQLQKYEGGHTIFGQWTQAAFQTEFDTLGDQLLSPSKHRQHDTTTRPDAVPADELAKRSNLPIPKSW